MGRVSPNATIVGFTIQAGNSDNVIGEESRNGGGIYILDSNVEVIDCNIIDSFAEFAGGGVWVEASTVEIRNSTFTGCLACDGGGLGSQRDANVSVFDCDFISNAALDAGASASIGSESDATFVRCRFLSNHADEGGAVRAGGTVNVCFIDCTMSNNKSEIGGALAVNSLDQPALVTMTNCLLTSNRAALHGGGVVARPIGIGEIRLTITNSTIANNDSLIGGGVYVTVASTYPQVFLHNSLLWNNQGEEIHDQLQQSSIKYCVVEHGAPWAVNSISTDPQFVDTSIGDYRLQPGSPAIDRGHNWLVPTDYFDLDYDGITAELTPLEFDNNPRFANGITRGGCGAPAIVDIGAFEFQGAPIGINLCIGDTDGGGTIDVFDLFHLLGQWGNCTTDCCLGDLNVEGVIDVFDLFDLLGAWGNCE